jgi:hypothetical protein
LTTISSILANLLRHFYQHNVDIQLIMLFLRGD